MKYIILILSFTFNVLAYADSAPPPVEEVFQLSAQTIAPNTFSLRWNIKSGFFLYKDRIQLSQPEDANFHLGPLHFPSSKEKKDKQGKIYSVYDGQFSLPISILGHQPGESLLTIRYQGCSAEGFCYPPQTRELKLTINNQLALVDLLVEEPKLISPSKIQDSTAPHDAITQTFYENNLLFTLLSFFGFGVLLAFTPCILPMIPVLSGIIVGHGNMISARKAFLLSLSYVVSMALTYAAVGAGVALMGSNLQIAMQSPWAIVSFSAIFALLACSMFGFFELQLPSSLQNKLAHLSRSQGSGHYLSAAIMGSLSTLILSPCVTAPLIGALGYIAQTGNVTIGSLALFTLGLGMGAPLLLIGTSAGKLLPKAGLWMNQVKRFFGIVLLGMAIYLLERILPAATEMLLWAGLFIFSGVYFGALPLFKFETSRFVQTVGVLFLIYGVLILIGTSQGNTNPWHPLKRILNNSPAISTVQVVKNVNDIEHALKNSPGKPVLLDFYADWCSSCKVIAATTLQNPDVLEVLKHFNVLKVDLSTNDEETKKLLASFKVVAPPTFIFIDSTGKEISNLRLVGELSDEIFLSRLKKALSQE